jgi:hypothetical protein
MQWSFVRVRGVALGVVAALLLVLGACSPTQSVGRRDGGAATDSGPVDFADADGDGISDEWEGARDEVDTDGDGTPDYLDSDSDGDGIPDSVEGRAFNGGPPADSDSDGTYDFRDLDSDDNGIPDSDELDDDIDGDGLGAYADLDDDGDFINDAVEIGGNPAAPVDTDGDGAPDFQDVDSDNDTIADLHEGVLDTDADGTPDRFDADSDDDGIPDSEEAGDADWRTPPIDSDMDVIADFRDTDSDGDGIGDADEATYGTDPRRADTDGDGVSDLVEIAACPPGDASCAMDATNPDSSPRSRGDFVFFEPYMMPPLPTRDTLDFATDIRVADVYFLIDTTGSMGGPIGNVRTSLSAAGGIIDQVRAEIPDTWFGVGEFKDYNACSYGSGGDFAYANRQDVSESPAASQSAINGLSASGGFDGPESGVAALYAAASGLGLPGRSLSTGGSLPARGDCPPGTFGYPCFRGGAVPIVVMITDVPQHNGPACGAEWFSPGECAYGSTTCPAGGSPPIGAPTPTFAETVAAANANRIRVIGVTTSGGFRGDLDALATGTGAVDAAGAPLVSVATGGTVSASVVNQIRSLARATRFDISVEYLDDPADGVDSWAAFVDHIEANTAGDAARGCAPRAAEDTDGDGYLDTFRGVESGTRVCFDIVVKQNDTVMPTLEPQIFQATLRVLGDGFTELDRRDVFFLVPGTVRGPGIPE